MGISIGLVGLGSFGSAFAKLFKSHPAVDRIALCDCEPEKVKKFADDPFFADKLNRRDIYGSLDDICRSDLDALVIITQPWLHAPQCIQAMAAGKHVYSAVPVIMLPDGNETLDWCDRIIAASRQSGRHYMLGETSFYRPATMFCRRMAVAGKFGDFVYAEGEYCHDLDSDCSLREVVKRRTAGQIGGQYEALMRPYRERGIKSSPMFYPTHSVSGPLSVMNTHAVSVTAHGYRNRNGDTFFADDEFSNVFALYRMANGSTVRIAETREMAGKIGKDDETFRVFGTAGSFSEDRWMENGRTAPLTARRLETVVLTPEQMRDPLPDEVREAFILAMDPHARPGDDFVPQGHGGSHPYLVHEFCDAISNDRRPAINAWIAARYMAMGIAAHQSALLGGAEVKVSDWGLPPQ